MITLCSIASGSSGNCIYIGTENTHLLVDAGISAKRMEEGLHSIGVEPDKLSAILITHEHTDHVQGLSVFSKRHAVPVYATAGTLTRYLSSGKCSAELAGRLNEVEYGRSFSVGDIEVSPFAISHDAVKPVSYAFRAGGHKIGMATDLGKYDETIVESLRESEILYLEANHDENMLLAGSYPYELKLRIMGGRGHLSNDAASELIGRLLHESLRVIVLGHLSRENNYPELAYETVRQDVCREWGFPAPAPEILVANRDKPSRRLSLE